ncbi:hypothetical protein AGMMS49938_04080 [Fibrobacterales bacterium]|nr:hypothetical protein AGMMS49938_04080 [Fibrobacterales bacterium]
MMSIYVLIFAVGCVLGAIFSWIYFYGKMHKKPSGKPQRITDALTIPQAIPEGETRSTRDEQDALGYEHYYMNKDTMLKSLIEYFHSRLVNLEHSGEGEVKIGSVCFWEKINGVFSLLKFNSTYGINETFLVSAENKFFIKDKFVWNKENGKNPINFYTAENLQANFVAGSAVSFNGVCGYITIDSFTNNFNDSVINELNNVSQLAGDIFRVLKENSTYHVGINLFRESIRDVSNILNLKSKEAVLSTLSQMLSYNFRCDRLMLIVPENDGSDKWHICEVAGEQREILKSISFEPHEKCLLYELFLRFTSSVRKDDIATDPYQCRIFPDEPQNLDLQSLYAVMPPISDNFYPIAIVLESKEKNAVTKTESQLLSYIATCIGMKLKEFALNEEKEKEQNIELIIDSNGTGELLSYYKNEIQNIKNGSDNLGILFLKINPQIVDVRFFERVKDYKKHQGNFHFSSLGKGEYIFSERGLFSEETFNHTANKMKNYLVGELENSSQTVWVDKQKIQKKEEEGEKEDYGMLLWLFSLQTFIKEV